MKSLGFLDSHCQVDEHRDVRVYGGRREAFVSPPMTSLWFAARLQVQRSVNNSRLSKQTAKKKNLISDVIEQRDRKSEVFHSFARPLLADDLTLSLSDSWPHLAFH